MAGEFEGKVAIVTGGATGIGFGSAAALVEDGASVVLFGPDEVALKQAVAILGGDHASYVVGDVRVSANVQALVNAAAQRHGGIDIVVNSAAVQPYGTVETMSEDEWDRTLGVNLKGAYLTGHFAVPELRKRGGGAIVNIASVQGIACQTNVSAYVASKGGLLALTRAMALDHARDGIRVNAVCPGSIDTPMLRFAASENLAGRTEDEVVSSWGSAHPIGRVGKPEDVGAMVAFLCSDKASFCTGGEYKVDGGLLAKLGVVLPD
ncbi:MAG TPA: glucose 1-dehydrogenase [Devosia sp.]|jgi:NAD(P)-dependent dehydrogenase (short-subunit alcohol dehydrogenase family)|uniref:SDR family NAD(P)-dependent oxidoreductase n=1 Tax=Devosia sp. TaxID=1871048 RepID=UPI002DDCA52B|nr:glucose 1-dehydrogenase [Devosia sp.]HEV2516056.1 glucose 1-dehydrogenase [Devosia sp.]